MPSENRIIQGDCIEVLKGLPEGSVDLIFADPPYNIGYEYDHYDDRKPRSAYLSWTRQWVRAARRVLKPGGSFWVAIGDEYAAEMKLILQGAGLHLRNWVIWHYTFGVNCTRKFNRSHAHLFYTVVDPKQFTFNADAVRVPSARQTTYSDRRANPVGKLPDDTWFLRPQLATDEDVLYFAPSADSWYFSRVCGTFKERRSHPCQLPEAMLERIIRVSSNPSDLVLDPFAGSGTTLAVAKRLGRRWLGVELSKAYLRATRERLRAIPAVSTSNTDRERAIREAFLRVCEGYSTDVVALAHPEMNEAFNDACKVLGIPGSRYELNHALLNLRKNTRLGDLPKPKRFPYDKGKVDSYSFAAEIAARVVKEAHHLPSLDELLADPLRAAEFDDLASTLAPGFNSFEYRWVALNLRKHRCKFINRLKSELEVLEFGPLSKRTLRRIPKSGGVYRLSLDGRCLYAGEAVDLSQRIESTMTQLPRHRHLRHIVKHPRNIEVGYWPCGDRRERVVTGLSHIYLAKPEWNLLDWCPDAA